MVLERGEGSAVTSPYSSSTRWKARAPPRSKRRGRNAGLASGAMASFFIDTSTGQVATQRQLVEAGIVAPDEQPALPWHRIQGTRDASTMWYAVMRRQEKGVYIGTLVLRHGDHHALLLDSGWEEVPVGEISAGAVS